MFGRPEECNPATPRRIAAKSGCASKPGCVEGVSEARFSRQVRRILLGRPDNRVATSQTSPPGLHPGSLRADLYTMAMLLHRHHARALKVASIAAVWVALIAVGRAVRPAESEAAQLARNSAQAPRIQDPSNEGVIVGTLAGKTYHVTLRATPVGTRYDVADANGSPVARMLDETALAATFPDIDVNALNASPTARIMSAEHSSPIDR